MTHQATDLHLVHRVDQPRRGAGLPERVTDVGERSEARAFTAELRRNVDSQQPLATQLRHRFVREAGLLIDRSGVLRRDSRRSRSGLGPSLWARGRDALGGRIHDLRATEILSVPGCIDSSYFIHGWDPWTI